MLQKNNKQTKNKKQTNKQKTAVWKNKGWFSIEKKNFGNQKSVM